MPVDPVIAKYAFSKSLDLAIKSINKLINTERANYVISKQHIEDALTFHMTQVENWSGEIGFKDLETPKETEKAYTVLNLYLTAVRQKLSRDSDPKIISINELIKSIGRHLIILGQPGAGKTTTMKYICQLMLHGEGVSPDLNFPIVIRLRELIKNSDLEYDTLTQAIFELLGLTIIFEKTAKIKDKIEVQKKTITKSDVLQYEKVILRIVSELLDELGVLVIIDGLDELPNDLRDKIIEEVKILCLSLTKARIILTSRIGEFHYSIENTSQFQLCDLDNKQIEQFTKKYLEEKESKRFLQELKKSPFKDTAIRPLILAHLLAIYEREKQIPEKPKSVYKKIINLYLDEWDLQRSIQRKSRYGNFEVDRKHEFLANMSYYLTINYKRYTFTRTQFESSYKAICENFDLPKFEAKKVADEIESHNGLLVQSGYEEYEFAHRSLQEYLSADHLVKLPFIPRIKEMKNHPNELALSIAISSEPTTYFAALVFQLFDFLDLDTTFVKILFQRIILEKIDFNQDPILALALIQLFTLEINKNTLVNENIADTYLRLSELNAVKQSLIKLNGYYEITGTYGKSGEIFIIENTRLLVNPIVINMPKKLYAHSKFLFNWE